MATAASTDSVPTEHWLQRTIHVLAFFLPWVFFERLKIAIRWVTAYNHSTQGRYEQALRVARAMADDFKQRNDWRAFEIQQLYFLQWDMECLDAANRFLAEHANTPPPTENRRYLIHYVKVCARAAFTRVAGDSPLPTLFVADSQKIRPELVAENLKRWFPLT